MLLQPKKKKFIKYHKGKILNFKFKSKLLKFGVIGMQAKESGIISAKQIESARRAISRKIKRKGKIWIRIFPDLPVTKKPSEVRMGKGKGNIKYWATKVKAGTILFELCGSTFKKSYLAFKAGSMKLSIKTKVIK